MKIAVSHVPPILTPGPRSGQIWDEEMGKARDQIGGVFRTATILAIKETKPFAPIDEGTLITGIGFTVMGPMSVRVQPSQMTNPYAVVQELGRRPGQPGPPFEPILEWVERKFGLTEDALVFAALAIQRKLHFAGMKGKFFFRRARSSKKARKMATSLVQAAIRRWARRVA